MSLSVQFTLVVVRFSSALVHLNTKTPFIQLPGPGGCDLAGVVHFFPVARICHRLKLCCGLDFRGI